MASLLARMNITTTPAGPVRRTKSASHKSTPYARTPASTADNADGQWKHDMFDSHHDLKSRIMSPNHIAEKALKDAFGPNRATRGEGIEIKGAAVQKAFNTVRISGLTEGTTPDDVKTIFQRVGAIGKAEYDNTHKRNNVVIRLTYKNPAHADLAVTKFNGQIADGRKLAVEKVGIHSATGESFLEKMSNNGLDIVEKSGSLDVLMGSGDGGSKLRSDALVSEAGSHVMTAPPGTNPADYVVPQAPRGGRGRGRARHRSNEPWSRGGRGGGRGGKARMDID